MRKKLEKVLATVLVICLGSMLYWNVYTYRVLGETVANLNNAIEIYKLHNIRTLNAILDFFEKNVTKTVVNYDDLRESNVLIVNMTAGYMGSGTCVKIKNDFYVLSCAHLVKEETDDLVAKLDDGRMVELVKVKIDKEVDLSLWKFKPYPGIAYVEIANYIPKIGTDILVVGNPSGLIDVITEGIISKYMEAGYLMTALIFGGNSGGAVIDTRTGKLIGVATAGYSMVNDSMYVIYSWAVGINTIKEFVREYESQEKTTKVLA